MVDKDEVVSNVNTLEESLRNATESLENTNEDINAFVDSYADAPDIVRENPEIDKAVRNVLDALDDLHQEAGTTGDIAERLRDKLHEDS